MGNFVAAIESRPNGRSGRTRTFTPSGPGGEIRARFYTRGNTPDSNHTVDIEQDAFPLHNRLATHVSLKDETGRGDDYPSLLVIRATREPQNADQAAVFHPGTYLTTIAGREIPLREALTMLDEIYAAREKESS